MRNINIQIHDNHTVDFENDYAGLNRENLQGNIIFNFDNFIDGQARAEIIINNEDGYILLDQIGETYTLPIKSSLLTGDSILIQLVIQQASTYTLTTDTEINHNKTYYTKDGNSFEVVDNPQKAHLGEYYEAETPIWKSEVFYLKVGESINATQTIPEEYPTWVETLNNLISETEQAIERAGNLDITATQTENGADITVTNQDGEQTTVEIKNGDKGDKGDPGAPGAVKTIVVQELPTENIDTSAIYLVPSSTPGTTNTYDEYMYINNNWEKLGGNLVIDLTNYVQFTDYAKYNKGGTVKSGSKEFYVASDTGLPYCNDINYATYQSVSINSFISKGTLENVITGKGLTTKSYVDGLVGNIQTLLDALDSGSGV